MEGNLNKVFHMFGVQTFYSLQACIITVLVGLIVRYSRRSICINPFFAAPKRDRKINHNSKTTIFFKKRFSEAIQLCSSAWVNGGKSSCTLRYDCWKMRCFYQRLGSDENRLFRRRHSFRQKPRVEAKDGANETQLLVCLHPEAPRLIQNS